jgi:uncharacterized protein (DUF488 family)
LELFTIGCSGKPAARFFELLTTARVRRVVDVRLNNTSQLAGFAKRSDLPYFLERIAGVAYRHVPLLAPTPELLERIQKRGGAWDAYERDFSALMAERDVARAVREDVVDRSCLLCSEPTPERCHRRLVAEHLRSAWPAVTVTHLI